MPVGLGPLETIVNVGWPRQRGTLVMEYGIAQSGANGVVPPLYLSELPWTTDFIDLDKAGEYEAKDKKSDQVLLHKNPPDVTTGSMQTGGDVGLRGIAFFYLGPISRLAPVVFKFKVLIPAIGKYKSGVFTQYWLWGEGFGATSLDQNMAHPYTTGDWMVGPQAIMVLPRAFDTAADRDAYLAANPVGVHGEDRTAPQTTFQAGDWFFTLHSYKDRKNFPVNQQNVPTWDVKEAVDYKVTQHGGGFEVPEPARTYGVGLPYRTLKLVITLLSEGS